MVAWGLIIPLIIPHPVITSSPLPSGSCQLSAKPPNHSPRPPCWTCLTPPGSPRRHSGATTWGPVTNHVIFALSPWFPFLLLFISSCSSSLCVLTLPSCSLSPSFLPPPSPSTLFQLQCSLPPAREQTDNANRCPCFQNCWQKSFTWFQGVS